MSGLRSMTSASTIWILNSVLADMQQLAGDAHPFETGGVLLGYSTGLDAVVTLMFGPGTRARSTHSSFHPDSAWQLRQIAKAYHASNRFLEYLGDWHSHPCGTLIPSQTDNLTAARIGADRNSRAPNPFIVIVSRRRARAHIFDGNRLVRCTLRQFSS